MVESETVTCGSCAGQVRRSARFCPHCGVARAGAVPAGPSVDVGDGLVPCVWCAELIRPSARLCRWCNRAVTPGGPLPPPPVVFATPPPSRPLWPWLAAGAAAAVVAVAVVVVAVLWPAVAGGREELAVPASSSTSVPERAVPSRSGSRPPVVGSSAEDVGVRGCDLERPVSTVEVDSGEYSKRFEVVDRTGARAVVGYNNATREYRLSACR